jgi:hypothetical protein
MQGSGRGIIDKNKRKWMQEMKYLHVVCCVNKTKHKKRRTVWLFILWKKAEGVGWLEKDSNVKGRKWKVAHWSKGSFSCCTDIHIFAIHDVHGTGGW